jgi:hypothetical protein
MRQLVEQERRSGGSGSRGLSAARVRSPGGTIHNHLRGWRQNSTGAWFVAVSEEHVYGATHCIDPVGLDFGREDLKQQLIEAACFRGYLINGERGVNGVDGGPNPGRLDIRSIRVPKCSGGGN